MFYAAIRDFTYMFSILICRADYASGILLGEFVISTFAYRAEKSAISSCIKLWSN